MALSREYFTDNGAEIGVRRCVDPATKNQLDEVSINFQEFYAKDYFDAARFFIKRGLKLLASDNKEIDPFDF